MLPKHKLIVYAIAHALVASASAQTANDADASNTTAQLPEVVVVGSRIRRVDIETSQPVFVLDRAQIDRTGMVSVGDILQDLTAHGAALNTTYNNGGNGETRVDLRNLGDKRTLVLVNGRRWNIGLDGGVDLNSIPLAVVERIEVLKDGASAIYGSDAIAGVVNITTRGDYDGAEANAYLGESEHGDGRVQAYDFTLGADSERGNVVLNVSYVKQEPIFAGEREISAVPSFGLPATDLNAGASAFGPLGTYGFGPAGNCPFNAAGIYPTESVGCNGRGGRPVPGRNQFDPATGGYPLVDPLSGYNFAPENYLQTPQERTALYLQGRYELAHGIVFSTELLYNERRSGQLLAPIPFRVGVRDLPPFNSSIPAGHVYNPFGQDVSFLRLRPGGQSRSFRQDADTLRLGGGLGGEFELFERGFAWDLNAIRSEQAINTTDAGQLNGARIVQALGPSFRDDLGIARCGTPTAPISGCVPLDPFRGPEAYTPEMLEFLYFTAKSTRISELDNYTANLTGDLTDLPAGPLAFAGGYEFRRDRGAFQPDALLQAGGLGGATQKPLAGESSVSEFYVEFVVPILGDRLLAEVLEINVAARHSDYDSFGATTNYKGGVRWKPTGTLLVRANYSQGFRAPSISELFFPAEVDLYNVIDYDRCVVDNGPTDAANCAADGVPGGAYEQQSPDFLVTAGGNPDLKPETAVTRTIGLVWSPIAAAGLDVALDWYRIEIEDAVAGPGADFLIDSCVFEANPVACDRTVRDPATGQLLSVDARGLNSGGLRVEGYDLTVNYRIETRIGRFAVLWDNSYFADYEFEIPRGATPLPGSGNYYTFDPVWRYRSNLDLNWQRGDWGASLGARYYPHLDELCGFADAYPEACSAPDVVSPVFFGFPENRIDDRWYFDLQASWATPWNAQIRAGVQNVLDQDPPVSRSAFANSFDPAYPIPGRFWYLSYSQKF